MKLSLSRLATASITALVTAFAPALYAAEPPPIELELFDSWVGRYTDMTVPELMKHLGLAPLAPEPALPFSPKKAKYYDTVAKALALSPAAQAQLEEAGLALVKPPHDYSMAAAYYELYTKDLPLLVTTDSILDAMHRSFDAVLAELEETVLRDALATALRKVHVALPELVKTTPALTEAAVDIDLYLSVALNLLESEPDHGRLLTAPRFGDGKDVLAILAKVASLKLENPGLGGPSTTLYGTPRAIDWSQFKPRGHYTTSERLSRYFRAMMWLGRVDTGFALGQARQLRAASLMTALLDKTGAAQDMQIIKDVVDLMVGRSDDLTPAQLATVLHDEKVQVADLAFSGTLKRITNALAATGVGQQRIRSQTLVSDPSTAAKTPLPPTFQVFGQRFILDSFVLSKVVYDDIIFKGEKQGRRMPTGLDVMAALGNPLATKLLAAPKGELEQWNYSANLATVRDVIAAWTDATWSDNLYSQWLDALRSLSQPPTGKHVPAVMQRDVWGAKMLQAQLASWAQLRHDTILYAKQSYTASVGCLYPAGFVEPYPAFYAKLGAFADTAARRFDALKTSADAAQIALYSKYFRGFAATMATLEDIAKTELAGKPLSKKHEAFLADTIELSRPNGGYDPQPNWTGWYIALVYGNPATAAIEYKPTIADVHTDPDAGLVLEVGTGNVDFAVVAIDNDGDTAIHVGPTLSYYEFTHPASDRLTDEAWTSLITSDKAPPRPTWVQPLLVK